MLQQCNRLHDCDEVLDFCQELHGAGVRSPYLLSFMVDCYESRLGEVCQDKPDTLTKALQVGKTQWDSSPKIDFKPYSFAFGLQGNKTSKNDVKARLKSVVGLQPNFQEIRFKTSQWDYINLCEFISYVKFSVIALTANRNSMKKMCYTNQCIIKGYCTSSAIFYWPTAAFIPANLCWNAAVDPYKNKSLNKWITTIIIYMYLLLHS